MSATGGAASILAGILGGLVVLAAFALRARRDAEEILDFSRRLSLGDFDARLSDRRGSVSGGLNRLAQWASGTIQELTREKAQLSAILSNMAEGVVAVDAQGHVLVVNPALTSLFSVKEGLVRGKPLPETIRHPELNALLLGVLRDGRPRREEVRIFSPEERVFDAHAAPLAQEGPGAGALLVLYDITRIRKLEQVRREFVANVSHELRTPLASIKGFVETLRAGAIQDEKHSDEFLEEIDKAAERLISLVDDVLELASIESGKRPPVLEAVDILELAREAALSLLPQAERKKIAIDIEPGAGALRAKADRSQLLRVLTNLLDNAIKYNVVGGRIAVKASLEGGWVAAEVRDTGPGIPREDIPRIFERFYRVDKGRSAELGGTGLGLSIVKHIVESHGGTVSVESELGRGAAFRFTLPKA